MMVDVDILLFCVINVYVEFAFSMAVFIVSFFCVYVFFLFVLFQVKGSQRLCPNIIDH